MASEQELNSHFFHSMQVLSLYIGSFKIILMQNEKTFKLFKTFRNFTSSWIWCPQISNYVRGMRWSLSILWYRSLLMWETKYWFYITFTLMLAWGNFSLTFQSLTSNKCEDIGHVVIWCNIQWVICSDNFYEQEKKTPHQMHVSLSDPSLWFIYLLEEPPAFCFDAPFAALEGGMIIVACSHWLTSFQMCAPDGYPENPPQTQISCLALTGWIQAETQIFCCAVLLSSW